MGINGHGDVIVDGGFTKCFLSMEEEGTFFYLANLAAFTSRIECNFNKVPKPRSLNYSLKKVIEPIAAYYRKIIIIDSQVKLYSMENIWDIVKNQFVNGDIIYLANSINYKFKNLSDLKKIKTFIPNFSCDNNKIIQEINGYEKDLYNEIYVIDIGEQKNDGFKFGDLILAQHNFVNYYYTVHLSLCYHYNYNFTKIKEILDKCLDYNSFSSNYKEIRNLIFGANNSLEKDDIKKIKEALQKLNIFNDLKYKILNWMLMAISFSEKKLPIAANKFST